VIDDVSRLNPVHGAGETRLRSVEEVRGGLRAWRGRLCVGGGRYSMGGQNFAPGALYLDLRTMNRSVWRAPKQMQNGGQVLPFAPTRALPRPICRPLCIEFPGW
jgi:hypothetical protein